MYVGALSLDLLLGDVRSLKAKRSVVRPILADLRTTFAVAAAEAGHLDLHRRALVGVAVVAADRGHCVEVLDACERLVASRPEIELLSARQQFLTEEDDEAVADAPRARKLADRIKVVVAETLETKVKDPRLGFITITDTRVTNDLQDATVFYTVLGAETARAETAAALESARGVLRSEVGRQTGVRRTPSLTFVADAIPETAKHIEDLLAKVAADDAELLRRAAESTYAGEPDPYRVPRTDDTDATADADDTDARE